MIQVIAKYFNKPASYFFEGGITTNIVQEPVAQHGECKECIKKEAKIELLEKQQEEQKAEIAKLNREIGKLKKDECDGISKAG